MDEEKVTEEQEEQEEEQEEQEEETVSIPASEYESLKKNKDRLKRGYKKHKELKENSLTLDAVEELLEKREQAKEEEHSLVSTYADFSDHKERAKEIAKEKWLWLREGYFLAKAEVEFDPQKVKQKQGVVFGTMRQDQTKSKYASIFEEWPAIAKDYSKQD